MNKFALSVFVILAIGMAEFPSTFGCNSDIVHLLAISRSTTTTTTPPTTTTIWKLPVAAPIGHHYARPPIASTGQLPYRSVDAGGNVFELELEGFSICNTDGTEGLTFDEINACRVNYNFTQ